MFHHLEHVLAVIATGSIGPESDRSPGRAQIAQPHDAEGYVLVRDRAVRDPRICLAHKLDLVVVQIYAVSDGRLGTE